MLREQTFDAGNVTLHYAAEQADGPPLVLLHGVTSRWQSWLPVMPDLAPRWRLAALDFRGHGRSGRAARAYRIADYAGDVIAFLQAWAGAPAVLVGHSLGAIVATAVGAAAPDLVRAIVLEDPPLAAFRHERLGDRPEYGPFRRTRDLARGGQTVDELAAILVAERPELDAAALRARAMAISQLDPEVLTPILEDRAKEGYDQDACLRRLACPALLLQGEPAHGGALADADAHRAAALLARGVYVKLAHVGHGIHAADRLTFGRVVHDFLESW